MNQIGFQLRIPIPGRTYLQRLTELGYHVDYGEYGEVPKDAPPTLTPESFFWVSVYKGRVYYAGRMSDCHKFFQKSSYTQKNYTDLYDGGIESWQT